MFLITTLISLLLINLFRYSISSRFSFKRLYYFKNFPFLLDCQIAWCINVHVLIISCISEVFMIIYLLSFLILFTWAFSLFFFFFLSLAKVLSILFIFSKDLFLISFFSFFSISFSPTLISVISFPLLTLDFICSSFFSSFSYKIRLSYLSFFEVGLYGYKLPSQYCFCYIP